MKRIIVFLLIAIIGGQIGSFILFSTVGFETVVKKPELIMLVNTPITILAFIIPLIIFRTKNKINKQEIDPESISSEFETRYQYLYNTQIKKLEMKRRIIILVFILFCISAYFFATGRIIFLIALNILFFIFIFLIKGFTDAYKRDIVSNFINLINPNLKYQPKIESSLISEEYKKAGFDNKKINKVYTGDYIEGFIDKNVFIKMCEVDVEYQFRTTRDIEIDKGMQRLLKRDKLKTTKVHYNEEIFKGIFAQTECETNVEPYVKISKNKIDMLQNNRVEMDSSEFEKHFNVYSENKIVAMQVLTSDVMMILLEFYNKYKIDYEILLRDKKIYLRFFVGPIFEPPIFKNSMDKKLLLQHFGILKFVLDVTNGINQALK